MGLTPSARGCLTNTPLIVYTPSARIACPKTKAMRIKENKYRCAKCRKVYRRKSVKGWIRSYCEGTQRFTRLILIKKKK